MEENGFSNVIHSIYFSFGNSLFNQLELSGIIFNNCEFSWCQFPESNFINVQFQFCKIYNLSFYESTLETCVFDDCVVQELMFVGSTIKNTNFNRCSIIGCSFEDATISSCAFSRVTMKSTHFLEANVTNTVINESNLNDVVFFGTKEHFNIDLSSEETAKITRPIVSIVVHPHMRGYTVPKAYMKLDQKVEAIPIRISSRSPKISTLKLNLEMEFALNKIKTKIKTKKNHPTTFN